VLTELGVPWAIATSGNDVVATASLTLLEIPRAVPVITRDRVKYAKPNPDLFLPPPRRSACHHDSFVVATAFWDMLAARRAQALGMEVLSGGYGRRSWRPRGVRAATTIRTARTIDELGIPNRLPTHAPRSPAPPT